MFNGYRADLRVLDSEPRRDGNADYIWQEVVVESGDLPPEHRASVERGLEQARNGEFAEAPDLDADMLLAEECEDDGSSVTDPTIPEQKYNDAWYALIRDDDRKAMEMLDEKPSTTPLQQAEIELGKEKPLTVEERIEANAPDLTEEEMVEYVNKKVRKGLEAALKPQTKETVQASNVRWLKLIEEAVQNRFELFDHFNLLDRIEDQTVTAALTFRYDPELKVGRFASCQEQFQYTHPEPIKFLRGRYTVDWNEKEKEDEPTS